MTDLDGSGFPLVEKFSSRMNDEPLMTSGSSLVPFGWSPANGLTTATVDSVTPHSSQRNSQEYGTFVAACSGQAECRYQPMAGGAMVRMVGMSCQIR